jgi:CheY-like chemotaxis protein
MQGRIAVLIIDDEPVSAQLYASALQQRGHTTIIAGGGDEALEYAELYKPHFFISDVQMPDMDGFEFCSRLVEGGLKSGPLMFFTGHDDISILAKGLKAGGDDFLIKGKTFEALTKRVQFWTGTGFLNMPKIAREKAEGIISDAVQGKVAPVAQDIRMQKDLLGALVKQVADEVQNKGSNYGNRLVERIYFLGRLSHLVLDGCNSLGTIVRFQDYLVRAIIHLKYPWIPDLNQIFGYFDDLSEDPRFDEAKEVGLMEFGAPAANAAAQA